jgi:ferredoxin
MAYKITDECIACGACQAECPNSAISDGDTTSVIDPNKCTECVGSFPASQCSSVCPVDAPQKDTAHQETKEQLLAKWKKLHPGQTPAAT